ncbi:transposable element Tcb1 transposase [Trichonephila clavipes]|nr:transposable element Tcb1 transposase [Trichonephila clavipes]
MARIVRHNDESVREGYIRNGGKEVKLLTSALKAFQCNNRIVMAQGKHLDDFLRGGIIGRLECGRTQLEVSEELGIAQSVISRLGNDSKMMVMPVRCVPLTATHCRLRLTWSKEHVLWTPQKWSCVMFSDESRFSLQSDSRRILIWTSPGTRYHQENTIERHRYGGDIYRDVILEQHVRFFRGDMGAEFLFKDDNARPHRANIVDECLQSEDITRWIGQHTHRT